MARLRTQIERLKESSGDIEISADDTGLLIDLIARRDALFYPWRFPSQQDRMNYPAILDRQKAYLSGAYGISAKAQGRGDWKALHYSRRKLMDAGLVTATFSGGQVTSLFPTEKGDATAAAMAGLPVLYSKYTLAILEYLTRNPGIMWIYGVHLSESKLFQRELFGDPADWDDLTEQTLPLLVRGLVSATFDTMGRVFYGVRSINLPEPVESTAEYSEAAADRYFKSFRDERDQLERLEYEGNEVYIPYPANSAGNTYACPCDGPEFGPGELAKVMSIDKNNPPIPGYPFPPSRYPGKNGFPSVWSITKPSFNKE